MMWRRAVVAKKNLQQLSYTILTRESLFSLQETYPYTLLPSQAFSTVHTDYS